MNFYKHHIGDYAQATGHLSFVEDAAYSRMLRKYYAEEKPLPADLKAVQRLVAARTKEEREAVETVLHEFFTLEADGWHNKRADSELVKANAQAETNRQIALEREARRKARQQVNESSTNRGVENNESLHEALNESCSSREPSQTPDTRRQTPDSPSGDKPPQERPRRASRLPADWALPAEWRDWARSERPDLDPAKVADRFRDFWVAKAGRDGAKLDWAATWRNWVRAEAGTPGRVNGQRAEQSDVWAGAT